MRRLSTYSLFLAVMVTMLGFPGCGQGVPRGDLGRVIYRIPDVPGADQPYELPKMKGMKSVDEAAMGL